VAAISSADLQNINNRSQWYNPGTCTPSTANLVVTPGAGATIDLSANITLAGKDNQEKLFNFLMDGKGLNNIQAAGIVGNLMQESGLRPTADNGNHHGIVQWGGSRLTDERAAAQKYGKNPDDFTFQVLYMWYEVTQGSEKTDGALVALRAATTIEDATFAWEDKFERNGDTKGDADMQKRTGYAKDALALYGNNTGPGSTTAVSNCAGFTTNTTPSAFVDGFAIYNQGDPQWGSKPYGDATIAANGCGPSAMAMIITALTGQTVTPDVTAAYAMSKNQYSNGVGSNWTIGTVLAAHWNLNATFVGKNTAAIVSVLQKGGLIITAGKGPSPFTSGGHFIVIRAVAADGKWLVGDSAHNNTSDKEWDPTALLSSMADGSVFAISKK